jgi:hypothetical protein
MKNAFFTPIHYLLLHVNRLTTVPGSSDGSVCGRPPGGRFRTKGDLSRFLVPSFQPPHNPTLLDAKLVWNCVFVGAVGFCGRLDMSTFLTRCVFRAATTDAACFLSGG